MFTLHLFKMPPKKQVVIALVPSEGMGKGRNAIDPEVEAHDANVEELAPS